LLLGRELPDPDGAVVPGVIAVPEIADRDAGRLVLGVDDLAVTEVDADVRDPRTVGPGEVDEVAR